MFQSLRSLVTHTTTRTTTARPRTTRHVLGVVMGSPTACASPSATPWTGRRSMHGLVAAANARNGGRMMTTTKSQQVRTVFIQTETTPNPESIKFVPSGRLVLETEDSSGFFVQKNDSMNQILKSPLATQLFKIDGVKAVYLGYDFVTVTKYAENNWKLMRPEIFSSLMDFFDSDKPVLVDEPIISDTTILDDDDEVVAMIKELIEQRIRPAVQEDGGDIRYVGFEEETGIVTVQLAGSCVGCPSSSITLKQGVENMLMHYIPEVTNVISLEEEPEEKEKADSSEPQQKTYEERLAAAGIPFAD